MKTKFLANFLPMSRYTALMKEFCINIKDINIHNPDQLLFNYQ